MSLLTTMVVAGIVGGVLSFAFVDVLGPYTPLVIGLPVGLIIGTIGARI